MVPQRIIAEYHVRFGTESEEIHLHMRGEYAQQATSDFHRRMILMMGDFEIGAVRFEPAEEIDKWQIISFAPYCFR